MADRRGTAIERGRPLKFTLDAEEFVGYEGETVAAALTAAGRLGIRRSARAGMLRGIYCNMGACYDCLVSHEGRAIRSCMLPISDGMELQTWKPAEM